MLISEKISNAYCVMLDAVNAACNQKTRELEILSATTALQLDEEKTKVIKTTVLDFIEELIEDEYKQEYAVKMIAKILKMTMQN